MTIGTTIQAAAQAAKRTARLGLAFGLAMGLGLPAKGQQPLLGAGQMVGAGDHAPLTVTASLVGAVTVDEIDLDLDFTRPEPLNGMDPTYGTGTPRWVRSATSYQPGSHEGVAYVRLSTTLPLRMDWSYGSKLANGSYELLTGFRSRQVGWFDPDGPGSQPYRQYGSYDYYGWINAGSSRTQYIQAGQTVELWFEAQVQRRGLADPGGVYAQTAPFTITLGILP